MSNKLIIPNQLLPTSGWSFYPATAWISILVLILITTLGILGGAGKILNIVFPAGAFVVGIVLYFRAPILYMGFSWWIWFLAPFVRRVADYRSGFTDPSPILLAPYLVGLVTIITLWKNLPKAHRQGTLPFILAMAGILYGFLIGLISRSPFPVFREFLDWFIPVLMGFHLFVNWRDFPSYYRNLQRTFMWGVLVTGAYGIFQYVVGPEWDVAWLNNTNLVVANGYSDKVLGPFAIRVFSTMQATELFSAFLAAALLLLFTSQGALLLPAAVFGYLSFLLSLARASWLGWFVGFLMLATSMKVKQQIRLIITVVVMLLLIAPLATMEPFAENIGGRLETLSNVQEDNSALGRQEAFQEKFGSALTKLVGDGIGGGAQDNTVIALFYALGWFGTILYMGGLFQLVFMLFQSSDYSVDPQMKSIRAVIATTLIRLPVNATLFGVSGAILWEFAGIGMAAKKYYQHQHHWDKELPQSSP
jgi:hypothetical protein